MENPIIEIRSAEDAAKWIGRRVRIGWLGDSGHRHWRSTPGIVTHWGSCGGRPHGLHTYGDFVVYSNNDPIVIELLDGAATPRPEGKGWQWCQTSEDALVDFQGVSCDIVAMHRDTGEISSWRGITPQGASRPPLPLNPVVIYEGGASVGVTYRGGAWIRKAEPAEISPVQAARDRYDLAIAELAKAAQIARDAQEELRERKALAERAAEDARYPLPEGWGWHSTGIDGMRHVAHDDDGTNVFIDGDLDGKTLEYTCGVDCAPLAVVRAVIARHDAENS